MDRKNWQGLDHHLDKVGRDEERGGQTQWQFCKGIATLHLRNWEQPGHHLTMCLQHLDGRDEWSAIYNLWPD